MQSSRVQVAGLVVQHLSQHVSHFSACETLDSWCRRHSVPVLHGVDTRALTQRLRERGTMRGWLYPGTLGRKEAQGQAVEIEMREDVFHRVAPTETMYYDGGDLKILLVDVGAKEGIVHCLRARGAAVIWAPWHADLTSLAGKADGVMISNGPGDPSFPGALTGRVRRMLASFAGPIFGICLGHQILACASGFEVYKLKYGHRGVKQPVREAVLLAIAGRDQSADFHACRPGLSLGSCKGAGSAMRHRENISAAAPLNLPRARIRGFRAVRIWGELRMATRTYRRCQIWGGWTTRSWP